MSPRTSGLCRWLRSKDVLLAVQQMEARDAVKSSVFFVKLFLQPTTSCVKVLEPLTAGDSVLASPWEIRAAPPSREQASNPDRDRSL